MRKSTCAVVLVALVAVASQMPTATAVPRHIPAASGTLFVTERQFGSVTAFDAATGTPTWTTTVGRAPTGVTQPHGTGKVYSSDEGSNQVSVLDRRSGVPLREPIAMGPLPHHLMATRDGGFVYVAEFGHNQVGVVDTSVDQRTSGLVMHPAPEARVHAVWITRDGRHLYAAVSRATRSQPGDVAKLDLLTGELCWTTVGADPSEILVTPDGGTGYVSVRLENKVKELDVSGPCPVLTGRDAVVGTQPDTLQLTNDGSSLVVALRGSPAQVAFLDTQTFAVVTVTIPNHRTTGHQWLSANGRYTFVAVETPGGVAVIDNAAVGDPDPRDDVIAASYPYPNPPGGSRPHGVFYEPQLVP